MNKEKPLSEKLQREGFRYSWFEPKDVAEAVKKLKGYVAKEPLVCYTDKLMEEIDKIFGEFNNHSPQENTSCSLSKGNNSAVKCNSEDTQKGEEDDKRT